MHSLLFTLLSLIVFIPVILFLPLGLTKKGKWIITIVAFLLSAVGSLSFIVLPGWKTVLILLLLIALSTYLVNNRFGAMMFMNRFEMNKNHVSKLEHFEELNPVSNHYDDQNEVVEPIKNDILPKIDDDLLNFQEQIDHKTIEETPANNQLNWEDDVIEIAVKEVQQEKEQDNHQKEPSQALSDFAWLDERSKSLTKTSVENDEITKIHNENDHDYDKQSDDLWETIQEIDISNKK